MLTRDFAHPPLPDALPLIPSPAAPPPPWRRARSPTGRTMCRFRGKASVSCAARLARCRSRWTCSSPAPVSALFGGRGEGGLGRRGEGDLGRREFFWAFWQGDAAGRKDRKVQVCRRKRVWVSGPAPPCPSQLSGARRDQRHRDGMAGEWYGTSVCLVPLHTLPSGTDQALTWRVPPCATRCSRPQAGQQARRRADQGADKGGGRAVRSKQAQF